MLRGALAAAVTPLTDGGAELDEPAFGPLVGFLADGGLDGILALGTTGEGIMLSLDERRRAAELFVETRPAGFAVAVHCGAQSTRDTVALAEHAASIDADAVAVIAPPYFDFDEGSFLQHFSAAAAACSPVSFYVYEFAARSGYAVPVPVIERLRARAANLCGLKVSDAPIEAVEAYMLDGLDVFVGLEPLVLAGLERGAAGTVSGLATAFPEVVAALVHRRSPQAHDVVTRLRDRLAALPFHAAMKEALAARGVPVRSDVRAPLRGLTPDEGETLRAAIAEALPEASRPGA
jgi:dihydrodipicolinate synthase/N-acetylneuraminate lyase